MKTRSPTWIAAFPTLCLVGCFSLAPPAADQGADEQAREIRAADPREGDHPMNLVFVAHRGGIVEGIPENTVAAYRNAIESGVDAIEIDLRGTRDGEVVVLHDETVDRTTNGRGPVSALTLAELASLDAGGGEHVPTYEEVLELTAGTGVVLLLDIKESPTLDKRRVVRLTERHGALLDVIVGARSLEDLRSFRELNPDLRTLAFLPAVGDASAFVAAGADIIRLWPDWIRKDPDRITRIHALGKPVWTTAGDAPVAELQELVGLGVDGILSDRPGVWNEATWRR